MSDFFVNYLAANGACIIIFGIMLLRDIFSHDRQERQIKYDHALCAFMFYFVTDVFWVAVIEHVLPFNRTSVILANVANYIAMTMIIYLWLRYVMAFEHIPNRDKKRKRFSILLPHFLSSVALIIHFFVAPQTLIDENLKVRPLFTIYFIAVPIIYIIAVLVYTTRQAMKEKNSMGRRKHFYIGLFPLMVVAGGLLQVLFLKRAPIFSFSCTILMLILYIQSMEKQISIDPLTGLNNRGALHRFASQDLTPRKDKRTFVMMLDVNDFKAINDSYGHAEGDRALTIVAEALKKTTKNSPNILFLGRFGGDEFVLIMHAQDETEPDALIASIRNTIQIKCEIEQTPYAISVGIGYDEFLGGQDTFQKCMQRADHKLYLDKEYCKLNRRTSA